MELERSCGREAGTSGSRDCQVVHFSEISTVSGCLYCTACMHRCARNPSMSTQFTLADSPSQPPVHTSLVGMSHSVTREDYRVGQHEKKKNGRKGQAEYFEWGGAQILRSASDCRTDPLFPTDRWAECTPHTRHTRHNKHRTDSTSTSKLPLPLLSLRLLDISINSAATRHQSGNLLCNQEHSPTTGAKNAG